MYVPTLLYSLCFVKVRSFDIFEDDEINGKWEHPGVNSHSNGLSVYIAEAFAYTSRYCLNAVLFDCDKLKANWSNARKCLA